MQIFKCKMCGGDLEIAEGSSVAECQYCGTKQTLPKLSDEKRANLYDRANHFRRSNDYDKAMSIYESILNEDNTDAEAYWSLVLCRYGIEYVEDPASHKRVPTVNRAQFTSIYADEDYKSAIQYADSYQKEIYEQEAKAIDEIQKGILAISRNEKPYDVFICYKETDNNGRRTQDSVLAQDLYYQLTNEGFKVFFSRITLEDKLGTAYEPYIFAALHSAKVMVAVGTKSEYFNAVWVKNEWSRYLSLIRNGADKTLIPAYKDMDPYDLPEEFSHLQAQDMSKLGFMQDLIRGIKKITNKASKPAVKETIIMSGNANIEPLLKRAFLFLEDGDWSSADEYCEKVLDLDPENAMAYVGKLMAELKVPTQNKLAKQDQPFGNNNNYKKAYRFANSDLKTRLAGYIQTIDEHNKQKRMKETYDAAVTFVHARGIENYQRAHSLFMSIKEYKNSESMAQRCLVEISNLKKKKACQQVYQEALDIEKALEDKYDCTDEHIIAQLEKALKKYQSVSGWKDADERAEECRRIIDETRQHIETKKANMEKRRRLFKRAIKITIPSLIVAGIIISFFWHIVIPAQHYKAATAMKQNEQYDEAIMIFDQLGNYKNSAELRKEIIKEIIKGQNENKISAALLHTLGLKSNGTVVATGYNSEGQCAVEEWYDIIAASSLGYHTIGLKNDGTVIATGSNASGQCNVDGWNNIVAVSAGGAHTIGLKSDGTVIATGSNLSGQCNVDKWNGIVAVSAGGTLTIGLKSNGTVVAVGNKCNVKDWNDIISISAGVSHAVGLKRNGTVVAVGSNSYEQCNVNEWNDIIAVSAGGNHTVGLKRDGTVVAVGSNSYGQCNVNGWNDIIAVSAGSYHTVGLKHDGTVVAVGSNNYGQCNTNKWNLSE